MAVLRLINLAVRFLLEVAALAIFAHWGATRSATPLVRNALAVGCPLAVAVLWGVFISPKAPIATGRLGRAGLGLLVFLGAAAALHAGGHVTLAVTFAAVAVVSSLLLYAMPQ